MFSFFYMKNHLQNLYEFLIGLLFPIECINCKTEGSWICKKCLTRLEHQLSQKCIFCDKINVFGEICQYCKRKNNFYLDGILIANSYDNKCIKKLIKLYKYNFIQDIKTILQNHICAFMKNIIMLSHINKQTPKLIKKFDENLIIPVPLQTKRLKWRGFNQSEQIAEKVANTFVIKFDKKNLVRIKNTKPQSKLNKKQRLENIINCFEWQGKSLKKQNIILIDDVVTTGATLNECAKILKKNGAGQIWAIVLAKN